MSGHLLELCTSTPHTMAKTTKAVAKPVAKAGKAAKGAQKAEVKASKKKVPVKEVLLSIFDVELACL